MKMLMLIATTIIIVPSHDQSIQDRKELRLQQREQDQRKFMWEQQNFYDWKNSVRKN